MVDEYNITDRKTAVLSARGSLDSPGMTGKFTIFYLVNVSFYFHINCDMVHAIMCMFHAIT